MGHPAAVPAALVQSGVAKAPFPGPATVVKAVPKQAAADVVPKRAATDAARSRGPAAC